MGGGADVISGAGGRQRQVALLEGCVHCHGGGEGWSKIGIRGILQINEVIAAIGIRISFKDAIPPHLTFILRVEA